MNATNSARKAIRKLNGIELGLFRLFPLGSAVLALPWETKDGSRLAQMSEAMETRKVFFCRVYAFEVSDM